MGNRAIITTRERELGVYVHWNGGRDSVEAFLEYCHLRGFRSPDSDPYGWARLCQVIANYMGVEGLSVGIMRYSDDDSMDPGDNGVYVIEGWGIVGRVGLPGWFEEQREYPMREMLLSIDDAQPEDQRLGRGFIDAVEVNTGDIRVGDTVYLMVLCGRYEPREVVAIAPEGSTWEGAPMVARFCLEDGETPDPANPNNYLTRDCYRVRRA